MDTQLLDDDFILNPQNFDADTIKKINLLKIEANDNIKGVKNARTALIVMAILTMIGVAAGLFMNPYEASSAAIIGEGLVLIVLYGLCAWGTHYRPRAAIVAGLLVYLIIIMLYALVDISTLYSGIFVKIGVIYFLTKGVSAAFQLDKNLFKLHRLGIPEEELAFAKKLEDIPRTRPLKHKTPSI